jgi:hypothetical protein
LADTRGIQQDEVHKRSIATQIKNHIDSVTAVLVLANGASPRVTVGTDYALSTLSTLFPKSLASNLAFVFTNVLSPLHWNFSGDTIPDETRDVPYFFLNNPVALQREYLKLKRGTGKREGRVDLCKEAAVAEREALKMLVDLFNWLDSLETRSMTESVTLHEISQTIDATTTNTLAQIDQAATKKMEIEEQRRKSQTASAVSY